MKKMMKRMFAFTMTALMSVGMFAGCFGGNTSEEDPDGKISISVKISDALAEGELMSAWKKAYEAKNPEVKIKISTLGSDYNEEMMGFVQAPDKMPDIMWTTGETHALWSSEGVFVDLKDRIDADASINLSDFYDEILKVTHINSKDEGIYFMPRDYN